MIEEGNLSKILIVDDEPGLRRVLSITLQDEGYSVFTAANGEECLSQVTQHGIKIVLLDIRLPGMSGTDVLEKIKIHDPHCQVIIITGHADLEAAVTCLQRGAMDFLSKPIDDTKLLTALKVAENRVAAHAALQKELTELERMALVGHTATDLSHSLKNIASILKGGMFVIEKGIELGQTEAVKEGWQVIASTVERLRKLALRLLEIGAVSCEEMVLAPVARAARIAATTIGPKAKSMGVRLECRFDESVASRIDVDALARCMENLLDNAVDACAQAQVADKLVTFSVFNDSTNACMEVADNGTGMDESFLETPFTRAGSTKGSNGTGVGLLIAKRIVDLHGGSIRMAARTGGGTMVRVEIPIGKPYK